MSIRLMTAVWAASYPKSSHLKLLIMLKLADHANDDGVCYPSQTVIAEACGAGRNSVNRIIKELEKDGLLRISKQWKANCYELNFGDIDGTVSSLSCLTTAHDHVSPEDTSCLTTAHDHVSPEDTSCLTTAHDHVSPRHMTIEPSLEPSINPQRSGDFFKPPKTSKAIEQEAHVWLKSISGIVGAKSTDTMADRNRWLRAAEAAIREQFDIKTFLDAIRLERSRLADTPQFFTPDGVLRRLQMVGPGQQGKYVNPQTGRPIGEFGR